MVDFTYLAKNYRNDSDSSAARRASAWWPTEKDPTGDPDSLNRDFLMGYLLHYCRLCQKLKKRGTGTVLQALLEVEPDNGELHFLLAQQHELENNLHESLACYERAASLRLDKPSYMLEAVRVACMLGERNRGMAMVGSVISAYPIMAEAYSTSFRPERTGAHGGALLGHLLREVALVAPDQGRHVRRHDVELAADVFRLPRLQPAQAEVAVHARDHALEQLLVRLPGHRQDHLLVRREAARQPVRRHQRAQRPGVHVVPIDVPGGVHLPRRVAGPLRPGLGR